MFINFTLKTAFVTKNTKIKIFTKTLNINTNKKICTLS